MKHLAFLAVLAPMSIALCACSHVRPGADVVVASALSADLLARYNVDRVAFKTRLGNACVYEAHFGAPDEFFEQLSFMARDRNACALLDRPLVTITSHDHHTLALVQSLIYGSRRSEFLQALKDKGPWDTWEVAVALEKDAFNGTFVTHEDGRLVLVVPGGINTAIHFTSTDPLQFTIQRWQ